MLKKVALMLWYRCNNNCRFCYCMDKKDQWEMSTKQAKKELKDAYERGCLFVDFNGGEPTLRHDLAELMSYSKKLGFKQIALTTNGRRFYYKDFCKKLLDSGLNHVVLSIHGHTPELHDYLTQAKNSYKQTTLGLKNLRELNPDIYVCINTTINRHNYKFLPKIAENNLKLGANASEFIFVHPRGGALSRFEEIVPTLTEISPYIQKTMDFIEKNKLENFKVRYLPMCYVMSSPKMLSEYSSKETLREQHVGPEFKDLNVEKGRAEIGRVKGPQCKFCQYNDVCEGIFKEYAEKRGLKELVPVA